MRVRSLALVAVILAAASPAGAQTPVEAARALVARYHEDPAELDPRSVRAHILAGNVLLEVPGFAGGDRAKAEEHFKKALEIDPRFTNARVDLARVYIAAARYADARRELQRVVDETSPSVIADWAVKDAPRARKLLESIKDRT